MYKKQILKKITSYYGRISDSKSLNTLISLIQQWDGSVRLLLQLIDRKIQISLTYVELEQIEDAGCLFLQYMMPDLEQILIKSGKLTVIGCEHLSKLQKLQDLALIDCKIGNRELKKLSTLKLSTLNLTDNHITKTGCKYLSKMYTMDALNLENNYLDDDAVMYIAQLKNILDLNLSYCAITDQGCEHLSKMKNLDNLYLMGNENISSRAKIELMNTLPNTNIQY